MIWKDLLLMKFENGFRILNNKDTEDKFFVIGLILEYIKEHQTLELKEIGTEK